MIRARISKKKRIYSFPEQPTTRFAPPVSPGKMSEICNGYVPPATVRATNRAVRALDEWREERNERRSERYPQASLSALLLNLWLARFVVEARRVDGDPYPTTIANCLGFRQELRSTLPNFMDREGALEIRYHYLTDIHIAPCTQHSHETAGYMPLQTVTHIDASTHTHTCTHTHTHTHKHIIENVVSISGVTVVQ